MRRATRRTPLTFFGAIVAIALGFALLPPVLPADAATGGAGRLAADAATGSLAALFPADAAAGSPAAPPPSAARAEPTAASPDLPLDAQGRARLIVRYREGVTRRRAAGLERAAGAQAINAVPELGWRVVRVEPADVLTAIADLEAAGDVIDVTIDTVETLLEAPEPRIPNDTRWTQQWGPQRIAAPAAWARTTGSPATVVAVVDTGVRTDHPDLVANLLPGYNALDGSANAHDVNGHGTHVAGTVAADSNNSRGVAGMCWNCKILPVKVMGADGVIWSSDAARGIFWAADQGADVINLSFGSAGSCPSTYRDVLAYARSRGAVVVAAAGNDGVSTAFRPAVCDDAISVAASAADDSRASFSNHGQWVEVAAPGVSIRSLYLASANDYALLNGTSMAAPHVAGLLGLARARDPQVSPDALRAALQTSALPVAWVRHGRVDADRFLAAAASAAAPTWPLAPVQPSAVPGAASATVSWNPPPSDGGAPILSYTITATPGGRVVTVAAPAGVATVEGLAIGTSYRFTVSAANSAGASVASEASAAVTPYAPSAPGDPRLDPASDTGAAGDGVTNDPTPTFTGTASAGAPVELLVGATVTASGTATGGVYSLTSAPLPDGVHLVRARADGLESAGAATVTIDTVPPTAVTFVGGPEDGSSHEVGAVPPAPGCDADFGLSGAGACLITGYQATAGAHTMTAIATDLAGNTTTNSRSYTVLAPPIPPPPPWADGATAISGDWDGDGTATPGWYRNGRVWLRNSNSAGEADVTFTFGRAGDQPVVGDWNDDGSDTLGIVRDRQWHLRYSNSSGPADLSFTYGRLTAGDYPLAGDWNADGRDTVGIVRDGIWHLRNSNSAGAGDIVFRYGRVLAGDVPLTGDWNADGHYTPGIVRQGEWHLRNTNTAGAADLVFRYGRATDTPVVGDWNRGGRVTVGVVRGLDWHLRHSTTAGAADRSFRY